MTKYNVIRKNNKILVCFIGFEKHIVETFSAVCSSLDRCVHTYCYKGWYSEKRLFEIERCIFNYIVNTFSDNKNRLTLPRAFLVCYPYEMHKDIASFFYPYPRFLPLECSISKWEKREKKYHELLKNCMPEALENLKKENISLHDARRLPLHNFDIKGNKKLYDHFLQNIIIEQRPNTAYFPPKFGHVLKVPCPYGRRKGALSLKDEKNWFFPIDPIPHGGHYIFPLGKNDFSQNEIKCFLNGAYRFGLFLEPGAHFDVLLGSKSMAFCCHEMNRISIPNKSYINLYPNDTWRD